MKILAEVSIPGGVVGRTKHFFNGEGVGSVSMLRAVRLAGESGVYLLRFDANGDEVADTLHDDLAQAMDQAQFEYGIDESTWRIF